MSLHLIIPALETVACLLLMNLHTRSITFLLLWKDRNPKTEAALGALLTFDFTKKQYLTGACSQNLISSDSYLMDQLLLDRLGNAQIQLELAYDYRKNIEQYPVWQQYLRMKQPPAIVIWGKMILFSR